MEKKMKRPLFTGRPVLPEGCRVLRKVIPQTWRRARLRAIGLPFPSRPLA
jgi:hypothetical protein